MKLGIDCHNLEGQRTGVGRYLFNLLREWMTNLTAPHLPEFNLYFKNSIPGDIQEISRAYGRTHTVTTRNLSAKSNAFFKHLVLPRAARQDKIDVLFCPDYVLPFYTGSVRRSIKTAVAIHDIIYEARPDEYSWPSRADRILLKWASKRSAKKADVIFTPSEFTKSEILKYYKVSSEKIVVTPLSPDPIFRPYARDRGRNGAKTKCILFVGSIFNRRFLPQKIEAFGKFGSEFNNFQFQIVGKNRTKPYQNIGRLVADVNRKFAREAVIWKEYASDEELVRLYNGAFATLWCSSYEGFGLPILESMACGTPVITSMSGSLPEVAEDAALYINNPRDPQEIAEALCLLSKDRAYYESLVEKGFSQSQKFSWQKTAGETIKKIMLL
jgi:glycosyltransferase involved in cell wall biosynthesis